MQAGLIYSFIFMFHFLTDSIRTKLNSEKKMHSSQMVRFRTPLELVSKCLFCTYRRESGVLYSTGRGKRPVIPNSSSM